MLIDVDSFSLNKVKDVPLSSLDAESFYFEVMDEC